MPTPIGGNAPPSFDQPTIDPALLEPPDQFGQDMFLKLMVAQLKYQNPLDPMDSSDFMAQTAQFTTVERLTQLTDMLEESLVNDRLAVSTGMIGRDVTFASPDTGETTTARVSGVRFTIAGPQLLLATGVEIGIGDVDQVSSPPTTS